MPFREKLCEVTSKYFAFLVHFSNFRQVFYEKRHNLREMCYEIDIRMRFYMEINLRHAAIYRQGWPFRCYLLIERQSHFISFSSFGSVGQICSCIQMKINFMRFEWSKWRWNGWDRLKRWLVRFWLNLGWLTNHATTLYLTTQTQLPQNFTGAHSHLASWKI